MMIMTPGLIIMALRSHFFFYHHKSIVRSGNETGSASSSLWQCPYSTR